jgi:hypothetical protein
MAVRYAGDVELRMRFEGGVYHAAIRQPGLRMKGTLTARECGITRKPTDPESYDRAAKAFLREARRMAKQQRFELFLGPLRRTFQSPCPT